MFIKRLINKYRQWNKTQKIVFWLIFVSNLCAIFFLGINYKGWHIPTADEIHHSKGKIKIIEVTYHEKNGSGTVEHIRLHDKDGKEMYFNCSYTAYNYTQYSDCSRHYKTLKPLADGKYAEVGWYTQKPFLGFKNPYPQLIYLSIEDSNIIREVIKQNDSLQIMNNGFGFRIFIFFAMPFLSFYIVQPLYKTHYPKPQPKE